MIKIKLKKNEFDFLIRESFLPNTLKALLYRVEEQNDMYLLKITPDQADEIRDFCGEQLQLIGFNDDYKLTPEGEILESLIDKCFIK